MTVTTVQNALIAVVVIAAVIAIAWLEAFRLA